MFLKNFNFLKIFLFIASITILIGCEKHPDIYYIAAGSEKTSYFKVGKDIANVVRQQSDLNVGVYPDNLFQKHQFLPLSSISNCSLLSTGDAHFAISQNDVHLEDVEGEYDFSSLRSVLPLYSEIFFLIYHEKFNPKSLRDLVVGRKVAMGPQKSGTTKLAKTLFKEFGIDESEYVPVYLELNDIVLSDSIDICCLVTGFDNFRVKQSINKGGKIFGLGDSNLAGKGSAVDGFCLKYPLANPYIIPRSVVANSPKDPILTVSVDAVLLTQKNISDHVVYKFIETLLNNKQLLIIEHQDELLSHITEKFDPSALRFPLHNGARQYLERNKPSIYERYAELFGVIFSIIAALVTGVIALTRWNRQRKKNRIDRFYKKILTIQKKIQNFRSVDDCSKAIDRLKILRRNAFEQLIDEKLLANESFRIFITFIHDTQKEIEQQMRKLDSHA